MPLVRIMHWGHIDRLNAWTTSMNLKLHPQISRSRRQTAVEQTSDLLKAYLEHWPDPFTQTDDTDSENRFPDLSAGFLVPMRRSA